MTALDEIQAHVPKAFEEIVRRTHVRPISIGVTRKGRRLAFKVSLPKMPDSPAPDSLFGFPVVYWISSRPTLLAHG